MGLVLPKKSRLWSLLYNTKLTNEKYKYKPLDFFIYYLATCINQERVMAEINKEILLWRKIRDGTRWCSNDWLIIGGQKFSPNGIRLRSDLETTEMRQTSRGLVKAKIFAVQYSGKIVKPLKFSIYVKSGFEMWIYKH